MLLKAPPPPATQLVVQIERNTLRGVCRGQGTHHTGEGGLEQKRSTVQGGRRRAEGERGPSEAHYYWGRGLWGERTRGTVRPERPAPVDGGLRSEGLCGDPGGSGQDWGAGSGGLRAPELALLPVSPLHEVQHSCAVSREVDAESGRPRVTVRLQGFGEN